MAKKKTLLNTKKRVILTSLSIVLSFLAVVFAYEIFENVRYYIWRSRFDNQGWFGKITVPSSNGKLMWEYRPYGEHENIRINRYGFRDYDYASTEKADSIYRAAFIGDSITLGMGLEEDEVFVKRFQNSANKLNLTKSVQALNFGVDGYNTVQISELLRTKVLGFWPDKVVYVMCLNDFDFEESSGYKIRYFKKPKSFFLRNLGRLRRRLLKIDYHLYHFEKNKDVVFQEILRMKNLLKQQKTRFQVVILPIFPLADDGFVNYPLLQMHNEIMHFLKRNEIDVLDLLDSFRQQGKPTRYYAIRVWHPNERGHGLIAQELLRPVLADILE